MDQLSSLKSKKITFSFKKNALFIVLLVLGIGGFSLYRYMGAQTTDNAYVKGNTTLLSSRISGYVKEITVINNQMVKKGDLLATLDDATYKATHDLSISLLKQREHELELAQIKLSQQDDVIHKAQEELKIALSDESFASKELERAKELKKNDFTSSQKLESATTLYQKSAHKKIQAQESLQFEQKQYDVLKLEVQKSIALLAQAKAHHDLSMKDLNDTKIYAPQDGIIAQKTAQVGQFVKEGLGLMYLIPNNQIWVEANYKETQLQSLKIGQVAKITVDAFSKPYYGKVVSFSPATGSEFSLLPSENATGNFTKIVRRLPVRIEFDQDQDQDLSVIVPGLSCYIRIDIRD